MRDPEKRRVSCKRYEDNHREERKRWVHEHQEQSRTHKARYRERNREALRAKSRDYAKRNGKKYRDLHKEESKRYAKEYRRTNSDKIRAYLVQYYQKNRERLRDRHKSYYQENKPVFKRIVANRSKLMADSGSHTKEEIRELYERQGRKCATCKRAISLRDKFRFEVDHVMPVSKGGSDYIENIQLLCRRCNRKKSAKHPDQWAQENGFLFC